MEDGFYVRINSVILLHGFGNILYAVTYPGPGNRGRVSPLTVRENTRTSPLTVADPDFDQCMQINRYDVIANYRCNDAVCKIFDLLLYLTQYLKKSKNQYLDDLSDFTYSQRAIKYSSQILIWM